MTLLTRTGLRINRYCSMDDFPLFKMAAVRHHEFLTSDAVRSPNMRHRAKFREDRSNRSGDMADFRFFKMAALRVLGTGFRINRYFSMADFPFSKWRPRHHGFLNVGNFNFRSGSEAHYASSCQISPRLVEPFRHLGLVLRVLGPPTKSICWSL